MKKLNELEMNDTGRTEVEKYVEAFMKLLQDGTGTISVSGKQSGWCYLNFRTDVTI